MAPTSLLLNGAAGAFIQAEAPDWRSRAHGLLKNGQNLKAGTILGRVTTAGADFDKYKQLNLSATDGTQLFHGFLFDDCDATVDTGDQRIVVLNLDMEADAQSVIWPAGITDTQKRAVLDAMITRGCRCRSLPAAPFPPTP